VLLVVRLGDDGDTGRNLITGVGATPTDRSQECDNEEDVER
jgi:hypothetical protein